MARTHIFSTGNLKVHLAFDFPIRLDYGCRWKSDRSNTKAVLLFSFERDFDLLPFFSVVFVFLFDCAVVANSSSTCISRFRKHDGPQRHTRAGF